MSDQTFTETEHVAYFTEYTKIAWKDGGEYQAMMYLMKTVIDQFSGSVKMLGVGPGDGKYENYLITTAGLDLQYFHGVEPNCANLEILEETARSWNVEYKIENCCFTKEFSCDVHYDLILMSHVLYYVPDKIEIIRKAVSMLAPQGKLVILHQGMQFCGIKILEDHASCTSKPGYHTSTGADIVKMLEKENIKFEYKVRHSVIDVNDFVMDNNVPMVNHPVSFLLQSDFSKLGKDVQDKIRSEVRAASKLNDQGKFVHPKPTCMIVIGG